MQKRKLTILLSILGLFMPFYVASAFTVLSTHKYAWSNNVGWINFAPVNSGVSVSDSVLSGSAWSENKGYINFAPAQGGVFNDGTGNLSGSAWGEGLGYIDFNNVNINGSTGKFSGTATGTLAGTITFDCALCDVQTDWRQTISPTPLPIPPPTPSGGGGGSRNPSLIPSAIVPGLPSAGSAGGEQAKIIDIEKDGIINILDFNAMMVNWGRTVNLATVGSAFNPADMNQDGVVDIFDFNMLMVYWGVSYQI